MKPIRYFLLMVTVICTAGMAQHSARAAELIMMEQAGCSWCERWHEEIGVVYDKTTEGRRAPLRIVNIHGDWPDDLANIRIERFTPTFVLVNDGVEIARQRGYAGDEFFWFHLQEMLKKLPEPRSPVN